MIYYFIIKVKDFDIQSLYGNQERNISGYIVFFIGYSLFEIPNLIRYLYRSVKEHLQRTATKKLSRKATALADKTIAKEKCAERNIDEELKRFNLELHELYQKFQELHDLMKTGENE